MINIAKMLSRIPRCFSSLTPSLHSSAAMTRFLSTNQQLKINPVAAETINYAYSLKTDDSYAQGLLILEQCESNQTNDSSKALVMLAMSKLLSERGNYDDAMEKLAKILGLNYRSINEGVCIAAYESITGFCLEMGEDDAAYQGLTEEGGPLNDSNVDAHFSSLRGLVELVFGNTESAESCFKVAQGRIHDASNGALSYAEFLHATREFSLAKELYQKVIKGIPEDKDLCDPEKLTTENVAILPCARDLWLAASCALGQLEAHMGNFAESEEILSQALSKTEEFYGSVHPKVGIVLTCIALMFRYKATVEHSSSLMIQEGLYRSAIQVLNAPPLESSVSETNLWRRDVIALARGVSAYLTTPLDVIKTRLQVQGTISNSMGRRTISSTAVLPFKNNTVKQTEETLKEWACNNSRIIGFHHDLHRPHRMVLHMIRALILALQTLHRKNISIKSTFGPEHIIVDRGGVSYWCIGHNLTAHFKYVQFWDLDNDGKKQRDYDQLVIVIQFLLPLHSGLTWPADFIDFFQMAHNATRVVDVTLPFHVALASPEVRLIILTTFWTDGGAIFLKYGESFGKFFFKMEWKENKSTFGFANHPVYRLPDSIKYWHKRITYLYKTSLIPERAFEIFIQNNYPESMRGLLNYLVNLRKHIYEGAIGVKYLKVQHIDYIDAVISRIAPDAMWFLQSELGKIDFFPIFIDIANLDRNAPIDVDEALSERAKRMLAKKQEEERKKTEKEKETDVDMYVDLPMNMDDFAGENWEESYL